jgi:hypothetical protein
VHTWAPAAERHGDRDARRGNEQGVGWVGSGGGGGAARAQPRTRGGAGAEPEVFGGAGDAVGEELDRDAPLVLSAPLPAPARTPLRQPRARLYVRRLWRQQESVQRRRRRQNIVPRELVHVALADAGRGSPLRRNRAGVFLPRDYPNASAGRSAYRSRARMAMSKKTTGLDSFCCRKG